jgi:hypothetical protein
VFDIACWYERKSRNGGGVSEAGRRPAALPADRPQLPLTRIGRAALNYVSVTRVQRSSSGTKIAQNFENDC